MGAVPRTPKTYEVGKVYEIVDDPAGKSGPIIWFNGQDEIMKLDITDKEPVKLDEMPSAVFISNHWGKTEYLKALGGRGGIPRPSTPPKKSK